MTTASEAGRRRPKPQAREARGPAPLAADVQRFGLLSAATVVSRYAAIVDRAVGAGASPTGPPRRGAPGPDWLVEAGQGMAEAALRLVDQATALTVQAMTAGAPVAPEPLELPATTSGGSSQVSVWLHNPTPSAVVAQVHVTCLVSGDGDVLPAEAVTSEPCEPVQLAATSSGEVVLRVDVPTRQPPGRYHGVVVASAAPEPVPLALQVIRGGNETP